MAVLTPSVLQASSRVNFQTPSANQLSLEDCGLSSSAMAAWVVRRLSSSSRPAQGATRMDDLVRSRRSREGFWKGCHLQDGISPAFRPQNQIVDHIARTATGTFSPDGLLFDCKENQGSKSRKIKNLFDYLKPGLVSPFACDPRSPMFLRF